MHATVTNVEGIHPVVAGNVVDEQEHQQRQHYQGGHLQHAILLISINFKNGFCSFLV